MRKLFLARHCEAHNFEEGLDDHKKKLTEGGIKDAKLLNKWFFANQIKLDLIYSSSAIRAVDTTNLVFERYKEKIITKGDLYLCNSEQIIKIIKTSEKEIYDIALVGHEPSISECLKVLVGSYRPDLKTIINIPYPAGGIAIIFFNIKNWQELDEKKGVLDAFISPNYLRKNEQEN